MTAKLYRFKLASASFNAGDRFHLWLTAATIICAAAPPRIYACIASQFIKDAEGEKAASDNAVSIQTLAVLENAIEPYRRAGYIIIYQSDSAITLRPPAPKFSWGGFMVSLFLLWPVAVVYLIRFNRWRDRSVCVRLTSQGQVEASGFTLDRLDDALNNKGDYV